MKNKQDYNVALYLRLSKDDDGVTESSSITTQKKMLLSFAKENEFIIYDIYIDDGYSGTNFDRPNFKRMIKDIKEKKVNMVITKDLSRLGRDYITTGQYTEIFFPINGVRYIAINDGYDSDSICSDIAPFKNVVNEMYARDISKKIRSAFVTKMQDGCFIGNFAPYGYKKDSKNKNHLIIDEEAANYVREIFRLAEVGYGPKQIAHYLNEKNILTPAMYRCKERPYLDINHYTKRKEWTSATISKMLSNIVYLGHMAQGKTNKISLKSKKTVANPKDEWIIVKDTHEPIITQKTYDRIRCHAVSRRNHSNDTFQNVFSGIAKCMDCGRNMSTTGTRKKGAKANLTCGRYKLYGSKECSNHFIDYETLYNIVLQEIQNQLILPEKERIEMYNQVKDKLYQEDIGLELQHQRKLSSLKARMNELDIIIQRLYEDNLNGKISEDRFLKLLDSYELEQKNINEDVMQITQKCCMLNTKQSKYTEFRNLLNKYTNISELTNELLHEFIDHIEIGQGHYELEDDRRKVQEIRIYYRK